MRSKSKSILIRAIILICLCVIMIASTSLALFTDTAEPITVRIQAGKLDVDLAQADINGNYISLDNELGNILGDEEWEPNHTRLYFFKVINKDKIPFKFTFMFIARLNELEGALSYAVFEDQEYENPKDNPSKYLNGTYTKMINNRNMISGAHYETLLPGEEKYYAVAIRMDPDSGNEYQNKYCEIDVFVEAHQNNAKL